jgi:hypothetical protein
MSFILSDQREDWQELNAAFARYRAYLASVQGRMPPGAYALATAEWWYSSRDSRAPHDAWLEQATVSEVQGEDRSRSVSITLRLLGPYHDGHLELRYRDVWRYRMEMQGWPGVPTGGHRDWLNDEFRLSEGGRMEHEIEWAGMDDTGSWLIEAADVEYRWIPAKPGAPAAMTVP